MLSKETMLAQIDSNISKANHGQIVQNPKFIL